MAEKKTFTKNDMQTVEEAFDMLTRSTQRQINTRDGRIAEVFEEILQQQLLLKLEVLKALS